MQPSTSGSGSQDKGSAFDISRALKYTFEDPSWVPKILIGAVFTLLSVFVVGTIWVSGYLVEIIRRTARGERNALPEWSLGGSIFRDGLRATVVVVIHILPIMILAVLVGLAIGGAATIVATSSEGAVDFQTGLFLMVLTGYLFFSLVGLAVLIYLPAALLRFVLQDRVSAAFDVRGNIAFIRRNRKAYSQALLVFFVASFIAQFGIVVLCVGFFPAAFWSTCVLGYALGELARFDRPQAGG